MTGERALLRLVVFRLGAQRYALPLPVVERALPMVAVAPLPAAPPVVLGVINVHGQIIPVVDVRRRLGHAGPSPGINAHLLVARTARRVLAMPVDAVLGVAEVAAARVTPPGALLPGIGHLAGIVALADGLLFIEDLDAVLSLDEEQQLAGALGAGAP